MFCQGITAVCAVVTVIAVAVCVSISIRYWESAKRFKEVRCVQGSRIVATDGMQISSQNAKVACTLAIGKNATGELKRLVSTLAWWEPSLRLYVLTDDAALATTVAPAAIVVEKPSLHEYTKMTKRQLEGTPGSEFPNMRTEMLYEKASVLEYVLARDPLATQSGVWFLDSDVMLLAPLPIIPENKDVALAPHYRLPILSMHGGVYNAGMMWFRDRDLIQTWRQAGPASIFYEQQALDHVASAAGDGLFQLEPEQDNFGYWNVYYGGPVTWRLFRMFDLEGDPRVCVGIRYKKKILRSMHVHVDSPPLSACGLFVSFFRELVTGSDATNSNISRFANLIR